MSRIWNSCTNTTWNMKTRINTFLTVNLVTAFLIGVLAFMLLKLCLGITPYMFLALTGYPVLISFIASVLFIYNMD